MRESMQKFLIFSIFSVILASCAATPPDPWQDLETETQPAATPLDCGSFPVPSQATETGATYDKPGLNDLNDYRLCSEDNEAIAGEHAQQINELKTSRKALTAAGQAQRRIADMKQIQLDDERSHNFWTSIGYWVVIVGMGFAL